MDYIEHKMVEKASGESLPVDNSFITPLNVMLLSFLAYTLYNFMSPPKPLVLPPEPAPIVFRTFTPRTLLPYNGTSGMPVYLAVRGRVFDVSAGRNFYGPGGPYANFAGRDASRGLASHSFDEEMLTKDLDGPLDRLEGLDEEQKEAMQGWEERFEGKYLEVGRLVSQEEMGNMTSQTQTGGGGEGEGGNKAAHVVAA
ncbi:putative membrane-associated progesterone receptor component 1 protein [Zalerion maritima]|uniref:Membrane-associated progesterone receptor component 1 protein n=1 Tax=Zalerion maritima TaxID=339359 RepID=A0AAD5WN90_9PEZI|nr:putative membrane-associated progesterone receptor component 1 protein [Zalerion maritima]